MAAARATMAVEKRMMALKCPDRSNYKKNMVDGKSELRKNECWYYKRSKRCPCRSEQINRKRKRKVYLYWSLRVEQF